MNTHRLQALELAEKLKDAMSDNKKLTGIARKHVVDVIIETLNLEQLIMDKMMLDWLDSDKIDSRDLVKLLEDIRHSCAEITVGSFRDIIRKEMEKEVK
jgi:hypothetical protein